MPSEEILTKRPGLIADLKVTDVLRLGNGTPIYPYSTAISSGVTATTKAAGSLAVTSHATGRGIIFYSDGSYWVNSGVALVPVKASGAELNTGTDDAKFATAKALKDADLAKAAATPVSADVFYFRTEAGVVKKVTFADLCAAVDAVLNP